jgi:hypothetical protein
MSVGPGDVEGLRRMLEELAALWAAHGAACGSEALRMQANGDTFEAVHLGARADAFASAAASLRTLIEFERNASSRAEAERNVEP